MERAFKMEEKPTWGGGIDDVEEFSFIFKTYKMRFYGIVLIALANIASSLNWLSVAPVPDLANEYFNNCGLSTINWFSNIFMLAYIIAGPVSSWVYDRWSIKTGIVIGAVIQSIGAWLRYFSTFISNPTGKIALALAGQVVCAIGQPFILNVSTPYAALWFSADGRGTASVVGGLANSVGMAVADLIIPVIVTDQSKIPLCFLIIACVTIGVTLPTFFIPKKPKTPPSYSASSKNKYALTYWQSFVKLITNYNFLIIMATFGILCGLASTLTSLLTQIVSPYGVSVDEAGYLGAAFIVAGLVGAFATGIFIDKTGRHKLILKIFVPIVGCMFLALIFVVKENGYIPTMIICVLLGFFTFSLLPVSLELSVECSYPVSESISSSFLWMASQVLGLVFLACMDALRDDSGSPPGNMRKALIMSAGLSMPIMIATALYNSPNRRLDFEERNKGSY